MRVSWAALAPLAPLGALWDRSICRAEKSGCVREEGGVSDVGGAVDMTLLMSRRKYTTTAANGPIAREDA